MTKVPLIVKIENTSPLQSRFLAEVFQAELADFNLTLRYHSGDDAEATPASPQMQGAAFDRGETE